MSLIHYKTDACAKYPEFAEALRGSHKQVFGNMDHRHEGDHYCFNPVCASCIPATDGILAFMPFTPMRSLSNLLYSGDSPHEQHEIVCIPSSPTYEIANERRNSIQFVPSSPSRNTIQGSVNIPESPTRSASPRPNENKKKVFDLFMNNLDNTNINWNQIMQALVMNGAR